MVLAGGGLQTGQVVGVTDELGKEILQDPVSLADFHATIYAAMGIDPSGELYDGNRPVPITDAGMPIERLFSG
jgi:arylsulfatase A-like enzyme